MSDSLPQAFVDSIGFQLGEEAGALLSALESPSSLAIRLNSRKSTTRFSDAEIVPWHPLGRYLEERPSFTLDPLLHAGAYYVQEPSSMFVLQAYNTVRNRLSGPLRVLDLCAAPGGKSTLLLDAMSDQDVLLANEVISSRAGILRENLVKWGSSNAVVSNNDPRDIGARLPGFFDVALVDAPCSGEGLFRKDIKARNQWSEANVALCSARQNRILTDIAPAIREGGFLIYSTCTWEAEENEHQLQLLSDLGFESVAIDYEPAWGMVQTELGGLRFYPHKVKGEGFYIALMQRVGTEKSTVSNHGNAKSASRATLAQIKPWIDDAVPTEIIETRKGFRALPAALASDMLTIAANIKAIKAGIDLGELMRDQFKPHHELAVSPFVSSSLPRLELDEPQVLQYLRKQSLHGNWIAAVAGWTIVTHQRFPLGWAKVLPNRLNNYYPKEYRIRM